MVKKAKAEPTNKLEGGDSSEPLIPKEYCDLAEVFSKKRSLTHFHPTALWIV